MPRQGLKLRSVPCKLNNVSEQTHRKRDLASEDEKEIPIERVAWKSARRNDFTRESGKIPFLQRV